MEHRDSERPTKKTDARTRHTRETIRKAFVELLREKPFSSVQLKEVCSRAGIHRSTFYRHYHDAEDWLAHAELELIHRVAATAEMARSSTGVERAIRAELEILREDIEFTEVVFAYGSPDLASRMFSVVGPGRMRFDGTEPESTWYASFVSGGCSAVISSWVHNGMQEPPGQVAAYVQRLLSDVRLPSVP